MKASRYEQKRITRRKPSLPLSIMFVVNKLIDWGTVDSCERITSTFRVLRGRSKPFMSILKITTQISLIIWRLCIVYLYGHSSTNHNVSFSSNLTPNKG